MFLRILLLLLSFSFPSLANIPETVIAITGKDFVVIGADSSISGGGIAWMSTGVVDKISILSPNGYNNVVTAAAIGSTENSDRLVAILQAHCALREYEATGIGSDVEYLSLNEDITLKRSMMEKTRLGLSVSAIANLARNLIWNSLRSREQYNVCLLIAGMQQEDDYNNNKENLNHNNFFAAERVQHQVMKNQRSVDDELNLSITTDEKEEESCRRPYLFWIDSYGSLQQLKYGAHGFASNFCLSILDQKYQYNISKDEAISLTKSCFDQLRVRYIINSPH